MKKRPDLNEYIRFLIAGSLVFIIDFFLYKAFFPHTSIVFAKAVAYIGGTITGFCINKIWTFKSKKFFWREIFKYIFLYTCTAGINTFVNKYVFVFTGLFIFSYLVATGISTIINFIGQKYFIFNKITKE